MADTEISILDHGPIRVKGNFVLQDGEGNEFDLSGKDAAFLCRCGHSGNKPFCDGSHKGKGFQSQVKAE